MQQLLDLVGKEVLELEAGPYDAILEGRGTLVDKDALDRPRSVESGRMARKLGSVIGGR